MLKEINTQNKILNQKKKVKGKIGSTGLFVRIRSPSLNSDQKATLKAIIQKKKKHEGCNSQNYQTLRL